MEKPTILNKTLTKLDQLFKFDTVSAQPVVQPKQK